MERIEIFEGDNFKIEVDVPTPYQGAKANFLILLTEKEGIVKEIASVGAKASFEVKPEDTATRVGTYRYEIRVEKGELAKVLVHGTLVVKESIILKKKKR